MRPTARQQGLMAVLVIGLLALGGCLTYNPSVTTETTTSNVFETVSVNESWASGRIRATAHLTSSPAAGNVTQITVIGENGKSFSTSPVDPGQTSVLIMLPPNQHVTLVASDTINGTTLATQNVTTSGTTLF
jgi:hypothetical protein